MGEQTADHGVIALHERRGEKGGTFEHGEGRAPKKHLLAGDGRLFDNPLGSRASVRPDRSWEYQLLEEHRSLRR